MTTLQCDLCMLEFPIGSFPDLDRGLVCEYCLAGEDSAKAQQRLIAETKKMADAVLDVQGIDDLMPKIKTVMAEVYAQYGGPRGFASKIVWVIDQLCSRRPVPASAGQLLINLMKLHQSIEASDESTKLADMSMEQLRREQELALTQLAMEAAGDPRKREVLFALLSRQGFVISQADPAEQYEKLVQTVNAEDFAAKTFTQQEPSQGQTNDSRGQLQPAESDAYSPSQSVDDAGDAAASGD